MEAQENQSFPETPFEERLRWEMVKAELREERRQGRRLRERNQRDRGIGYLFYVARLEARLTQAELATRMRTSRARVSHWEDGRQLPTLRTLENLAQATDLELVVGLRERDAADWSFLVLGVTEDDWNATELRLLVDYKDGTERVPITGWRRRLETEFGD